MPSPENKGLELCLKIDQPSLQIGRDLKRQSLAILVAENSNPGSEKKLGNCRGQGTVALITEDPSLPRDIPREDSTRATSRARRSSKGYQFQSFVVKQNGGGRRKHGF
ncbi:hypothetical protein MRB53_005971 [Persea americana]|uniref:Uncharacterized protein n=1 Tax=Persea americana TaxID=3435 RepID=A0ACC2MFC5_PERAE|nr:hypothetical protein MRB53_005971 [Persea americana]